MLISRCKLYRRSTVSETASVTSDVGHEDGDTVFLVYLCVESDTIKCHNLTSISFIFTLQEFAQELILLVDIMGQLYDAEQEAQRYRGPWGWLQKTVNRVVRTVRPIFVLRKGKPMRRPGAKQGVRKTLRRKFCELHRLGLDHF